MEINLTRICHKCGSKMAMIAVTTGVALMNIMPTTCEKCREQGEQSHTVEQRDAGSFNLRGSNLVSLVMSGSASSISGSVFVLMPTEFRNFGNSL